MEKPHIAVVPSPGFTHLVPILEFSKRFVHLHPDFHVTCIIPSVGSPPTSSKAYLQTLPPSITSIFLPPISLEQLPDATILAVQIEHSVATSLPYLKEELKSLCSRTRVVALVVDVFAHKALDFATELNLLSYIYLPQAAMLLSTYFYSSELDEILSSESRDPQEPIKIPGCVPVLSRDLPLAFQFRSNIGYKQFLERGKRFHIPDGVFVNSFFELEAGAIKALQEEQIIGKPKVYPVGPIIQSGSIGQENGLECLTWLDKQEPKSVLYVSFGSGGTLSQEQFNELAFGLELSGQKFLWVVRAPSGVSSATYLGGGGAGEDPLQFLPHGFLERTKKQGLVVPFWVPQIQVLGHSSTGGFLSHCGWNSVLESVVDGVPIIAWPLFAEQSLNAAMLTDGLKVALRPKVNDGGLAEREEIANIIRDLMESEEGREIQKRMEHLMNAAANAIKEGGSSTRTLSEVAANWRGI
ncbi:UDP-glycosyltransferase family, conserved site [Sesbania bispinosa]|nr:UDP-glycosyltransferase family, conserved site [Sesbania bispinosa]